MLTNQGKLLWTYAQNQNDCIEVYQKSAFFEESNDLFFASKEYWEYHAGQRFLSVYQNKKLLFRLYLHHRMPLNWIHAPYAYTQNLTSFCFSEWFEPFMNFLRSQDFDQLQIKLPWFQFNNELNTNGLMNLAYTDRGYVLNVHTFYEQIHLSEKRRIKKALLAGFKIQLDRNPTTLQAWYQLLLSMRNRKGFPIPLSFESIQSQLNQFSNHYQLITIWDGSVCVAGTFLVHVNPDMLYYWLPCDSSAHLKFSPTAMLIEACVAFAVSKNYSIIDLGIASVEGILNIGLANFKEKMGANAVEICVYQRNL